MKNTAALQAAKTTTTTAHRFGIVLDITGHVALDTDSF